MGSCDSLVNISGLTSSVPAAPLTQAFSSGLFVAYVNVLITVPAATGSLTTSLAWSNGINAASEATLISPDVDLTTINEHGVLLGPFYAIAEQPIMYSTSLSNVTGNPVYTLRLRLVSLG